MLDGPGPAAFSLGALNAAGVASCSHATVASVQITTLGTVVGGVITVEVSNDSSNWVAIAGRPVGSTTPGTLVATVNAVGAWLYDVAAFAQVRARMSGYTSGAGLVAILATATLP